MNRVRIYITPKSDYERELIIDSLKRIGLRQHFQQHPPDVIVIFPEEAGFVLCSADDANDLRKIRTVYDVTINVRD